jgi:predicted enzyme related to lactoylglutathione lyase
MADDEDGRRAAFYAEVFGLREVDAGHGAGAVLSDGHVELAIGNASAAALPRPALYGLAFQVDDVAALLERAYAAGAQPGEGDASTSEGTWASLRDPQGQRIDVYQRGVQALAR